MWYIPNWVFKIPNWWYLIQFEIGDLFSDTAFPDLYIPHTQLDIYWRTKSGNNQLIIKLPIGYYDLGIGTYRIGDWGKINVGKTPIPNSKSTIGYIMSNWWFPLVMGNNMVNWGYFLLVVYKPFFLDALQREGPLQRANIQDFENIWGLIRVWEHIRALVCLLFCRGTFYVSFMLWSSEPGKD